jgi:hypothetical protein
MTIMRKTILLLFLLLSCSAKAQQLITATGGEAGGVIWSVGEMMTAVLNSEDANAVLSQGFLQPGYISTTAIPDLTPDKLQLNAYPNPVINQLHVTSTNLPYTWKIYDSIGKILGEGNSSGQQDEAINFSRYGSGYYLLVVATAEGTHSIKVIK